MNNFISSKLIGGLGNQLFSISHALSQGWKNNREVIFLPTSFTPLQGNNTSYYINNILRNLKFVNSLENFTVISELSFYFKPINPVSTNTVFDGYFQSSKHWYGYNNEIKKIFQPDDETINYLMKKYPELNDNTVSIHIRRGDYLNSPLTHPTISLEYITESLKLIDYDTIVFIFTDDLNWAKKNIIINNKIIFVNEKFDWLELYLMSMCKHNIISNSTFSWWASFLNMNQNKIVIAPSIWFGPNGPKRNDLYEENWKIINVELTENNILIPKKI